MNKFDVFCKRGHGHSIYLDTFQAKDLEEALDLAKKAYPKQWNDPKMVKFYVCSILSGKYTTYGKT